MTLSDKLLIRYLLGELSDADRDRVEDRYMSDDATHEQLLALEEELIDRYLQGKLSATQKEHFESHFLSSPARLEKLHFAKTLGRYTSEVATSQIFLRVAPTPWWGALRVFLATRPYALAIAAGVLLLAIIIPFQVMEYMRNQAGSGPPTTQHQIGKGPVSPAETISAPQHPMPFLALVLKPQVRSQGEENRLEIPPGKYRVRLQLDMEDDFYQSYGVILQTAAGRSINQIKDLKPETVEKQAKAIFVVYPSDIFVPGDYVLKLTGFNPDGSTETAGGYTFHVPKPRAK
jgi:hypothetical protein